MVSFAEQVLKLVPKETEGEHFEVALARICRCLGGGAAAENSDSDSDLEVISDSVTVNLLCPVSSFRLTCLALMNLSASFTSKKQIICLGLSMKFFFVVLVKFVYSELVQVNQRFHIIVPYSPFPQSAPSTFQE